MKIKRFFGGIFSPNLINFIGEDTMAKTPISSVDVIPVGFNLTELLGKPLKKVASLLRSYKLAKGGETLKILLLLEDAEGWYYLRSDDLDSDDDYDVFHDLGDLPKSPHAEDAILSTASFPDSVYDEETQSVKVVIRLNIGGSSDSGVDIESLSSTTARILRQSFARHEQIAEMVRAKMFKRIEAEQSMCPVHSSTKSTLRSEE